MSEDEWTQDFTGTELRKGFGTTNFLLTTIAFLIALSLAAGVVLGFILYDRFINRLDNIEKELVQISGEVK